MPVDDPVVVPMPWWLPLLLLLALLFAWPMSVQLIAGPVPANADEFFLRVPVGGWSMAYGAGLEHSRVRSTVWRKGASKPYLLATDWGQQFPGRILILSVIWTVVGLALLYAQRGKPLSASALWISAGLACFPWVYLVISCGAGSGYGELIAAMLNLQSVGTPPVSWSSPDVLPPTEHVLALGAVTVLLGLGVLYFIQVTRQAPTLPNLLGLDLTEHNPGRLFSQLPHMQARPTVQVATTGDPSSSALVD